MHWIPFPDPRLPVFGLPWFAEDSPRLWRLPTRLKESFSEPVWSLAQCPAGGRIRFATDAGTLGVRLRYETHGRMHNMCTIGQMGVDLYVDGRYYKTAFPKEAGEMECVFVEGIPAQRREVTLYLPLYHPVEVLAVGVNEDAALLPPAPFAVPAPVAFYGTSITQGGCASRGGLAYQAILARALNIDFVNLGFSGHGKGEPEVARALAEIPASCFVMDFAQNCPTVADLESVYAPFLAVVREAHPATPILCITPITATAEFWSAQARERLDGMRRVIRDAVAARRSAGDTRVTLVEGLELLGPDEAEGFVDGVHPNDLGFEAMAGGLLPALAAALGI